MTVPKARKNSACRYCGSERLVQFLSLGEQPPSNSFLKPDQIVLEQRYPLDVYWCEECCLVQLLDVVPAEAIFDDYAYLSSTSGALRRHYAGMAATLSERCGLKAGDVVADIGCNDGILLNEYADPELVKVGVEPSQVGTIAAAAGHHVFKAFFSTDTAEKIVAAHGRAKLVTATNVYAHVDDIAGFTRGIPALLDDDGVFVIEAPYLVDLIDQGFFDTIYHEHLCYLALSPMVPFLDGIGLRVCDVERVPFGASGPAFRVFVCRKESSQPTADAVGQMLADEKEWGIGEATNYLRYAERVNAIKDTVLQLLYRLKREGARIGGYGAPAKGNTLLNYFGLTTDVIDCIAETNEKKQGALTPGSHIPIVSEEEFLERMPEYALLLTWNYLDFFLEKSGYIKQGGRFVVPLPVPRIAPDS